MAHNTEIKVNGMLTDVVEFDNSAQDIDDAATKSKWQSNPNLLDNSVFLPGCLVDQREGYVVPPGTQAYSDSGLTTATALTSGYRTVIARTSTYIAFRTAGGGTEYVAPGSEVRGYTGSGYGIDRWYSTGVCLIEDAGITIMDSIFQRIENPEKLNGLTLTFSVLDANGNLYTGTKVFDYSANDVVFYGPKDGIQLLFNKYWNGFQIIGNFKAKAAKPELGGQQTLAHLENGVWALNELPKYADTLARCQRYYQLYSSAEKRPSKATDCRPTMRTDPVQGTIIIGGVTCYYNDANL